MLLHIKIKTILSEILFYLLNGLCVAKRNTNRSKGKKASHK